MIRRTAIRLLKIALACALTSQGVAPGSSIFVDYPAGSPPAGTFAPDLFDWLPQNASGAGAAIANDAGLGRNAWRVTDSSTALPNPHYLQSLSATQWTAAQRDGWRLSTYARYVDDFGDGPNQGLTAYLGNREYDLMLDLDAARNLRATFYDETNASFTLTTGGNGAAAFHNFSLRNVPGSASVQFYFDGQLINANRAWDGVPFTHAHTIQWGAGNRAGASRGVMDYNYAAFEIGPFAPALADFDGNGGVDGDDLLWWQRTLGSSQNPEIDGNANGLVDFGDLTLWKERFGTATAATATLPEPGTLTMLYSLLALRLLSSHFNGRARLLPSLSAARSG